MKLAETAFDNFLQENDRLSMEAQKKYSYYLHHCSFLKSLNHRAEFETKKTNEKEEEIKRVEAEILKIKSDIYNLKDVFTQYSMYGKFLTAVSPEDWRKERVMNLT